MKKAYCLSALILMTTICNAQFPKGTKMIDLSMSTSYNASETENHLTYSSSKLTTDQFNIGFYPTYGIAIKDNLMLGFGPTYKLELSQNTSVFSLPEQINHSKTNTNYFGAKVSLKKFHLIKDNLFWYWSIESLYEHGIGTQEINSINYDFTADNIGVYLSAGLASKISNRWLLFGSIGNLGWSYESNKTTDSEGELSSKGHSNSFRFNAISLSLGLSYILNE